MKTIGLLGGMTWESTAIYYQLINREVQRRLGGLHSARILMHSFDFEDISALQRAGRWDDGAAVLADAGQGLVTNGAEFLVLCCNTMHCVSPAIEQTTGVPLLHIADPLGEAARRAGHRRLGLIGTRYTMEMPAVISARLKDRHGVEVVVPESDDRAESHRIIYDELGRGVIREDSRDFYRRLMTSLVARGAEAIVLGCTELPLIVKTEDSAVPQLDTMALHAAAIVEFALETA